MVYIILSGAVAATKLPTNDEGWFNLTGQEFELHGKFATPLVETTRRTWARLNDRNYMILPGYPIMVAGWFVLLGPGLLTARAFTLVCGGIAIAAVYSIVRRLLGSPPVAVLTAAVLALDYPFLAVGADARMDVPCLALGITGVALYLRYRDSNFALALFLSETLVAAGCLTHVNGVVCFAILHFVILRFDRRRIRSAHVLLAVLPYAVLGGAWLRFVLQDFSEFRAQFGTQSAGRLRAFWHPTEIWYGLKEGILDSFGVGAIGTSRAIRFNVAALVVYVAGLAGLLASPALRRMRNMSVLLTMMAIAAGWLIEHNSTVSQLYVVFLTPFLAVPLATCLAGFDRCVIPRGWFWWALFAVFAAVSVGGAALRVRQNDYHRRFIAAFNFVHDNPLASQGVFASGEFGFPLGRMPSLVDDNLLGFYSGKQAALIVMDPLYTTATTDWAPTGEQDKPAFSRYRDRLLSQDFRKTYDDGTYRIFARKDAPQPARSLPR